HVDHQVVTRPAEHGHGVAGHACSGPGGAQPRTEIPGPAQGLVHGRHAVPAELVGLADIGARRVCDDDGPHSSTSVTCGYNRMYASPMVAWGSPRLGPALRLSCTPRRLARSV